MMNTLDKQNFRDCHDKGSVVSTRIFLLRISVLLCICIVMSGTVFATEPLRYKLPEIEVAPGLQTQWIARQIVMNGVPMSIQAFASEISADEVLDYYEHNWKSRGLGRIIRSEFGGAKSIGIEHRGNYYNIQVNDNELGAEGVLTVSQSLSEAVVSRDTDFPLMYGSDVMARIESNDFEQIAETLVVENDHSVSSNATYFNAKLKKSGWVTQSYTGEEDILDLNANRVLNFQNGQQVCQIAITNKASSDGSGRTAIVINWIKKQ